MRGAITHQIKAVRRIQTTIAMGGTGQQRSNIQPGAKVQIVLKADQRTGKLTEGTVQRLLTNSATHPHGIKVQLTDGKVGRVQKVIDT